MGRISYKIQYYSTMNITITIGIKVPAKKLEKIQEFREKITIYSRIDISKNNFGGKREVCTEFTSYKCTSSLDKDKIISKKSENNGEGGVWYRNLSSYSSIDIFRDIEFLGGISYRIPHLVINAQVLQSRIQIPAK